MILCCTLRRPLSQVWALIVCCHLRVLPQPTVGAMTLAVVVVLLLLRQPQQLLLLHAICSLTSLTCCPHSFRTSPHSYIVRQCSHLLQLPLSQPPKSGLYHDKTVSLSTTNVLRQHKLPLPHLIPCSITSVVECLGISRPPILVMLVFLAVHWESTALLLTISLPPGQSSTDPLSNLLMDRPHRHPLVGLEKQQKAVPAVVILLLALGHLPELPILHLLHPLLRHLPRRLLPPQHLPVHAKPTPFQALLLHLLPLGSSHQLSLCLLRKHIPSLLPAPTPLNRPFPKHVCQAMARQWHQLSHLIV